MTDADNNNEAEVATWEAVQKALYAYGIQRQRVDGTRMYVYFNVLAHVANEPKVTEAAEAAAKYMLGWFQKYAREEGTVYVLVEVTSCRDIVADRLYVEVRAIAASTEL